MKANKKIKRYLQLQGNSILKLLSEKDKMYGYEITIIIEDTIIGRNEMPYGAIYPILHKFESEGIVSTSLGFVDNRIRIYYSLVKNKPTIVKRFFRKFLSEIHQNKNSMIYKRWLKEVNNINPDFQPCAG